VYKGIIVWVWEEGRVGVCRYDTVWPKGEALPLRPLSELVRMSR
jgi:hypothetical protein